jgi:hypothetical protein
MGLQIDPKHVVGRDRLIAHIWSCLRMPPQQASLRFTAERRVGKTTVMTKMAAEPADGFDVLFLEVEGLDSCQDLTELLINRMRPWFNRAEKARSWFEGFWKVAGGTEISGVIKLPVRNELGWKTTLEKAIEGFCQNRPDRIVLLMFDELPYMLQKIEQVSAASKAHQALTLLDLLRVLRQRHSNLRMIFAGSVGLHHVLRDLKQTKLASAPVNNMPIIEIPPLEEEDAMLLANQLFQAEQIELVGDPGGIAHRLTDHAGRVPFYMERITSQLSMLGRPIDVDDVDRVVLEQLTSDSDPWEMEHFRSRLKTYYRETLMDIHGKPIAEDAIARAVLDHFALTDEPQTIEQVWAAIRSQFALADRQIAVQMLKSLGQDHYVVSDTRKRYAFRFPLIRRWWRIAQGLEA